MIYMKVIPADGQITTPNMVLSPAINNGQPQYLYVRRNKKGSCMSKFSLTYDKDYGINNRKGWTVCVNGSTVVELERFLLVAFCKAFLNRLTNLKRQQ